MRWEENRTFRYLVLASYLMVASIAIIISSSPTFGQTAAPSEVQSVHRDCDTKGLPFWDCDCVVQEFKAAKTAEPEQNWRNLIADIYNTKCFDAAKISKHYETTQCPKHNKMAAFSKKPQADCACYGKLMAERILGREFKVVSYRGMGKLESEVREQCR